MLKIKLLVVSLFFLIGAQDVFGDDRAMLVGNWRLVSYEVEFQTTGERELFFGKNPMGYIIFTPEGRFMTVLTGDGRKSPATDQDRAELLKSMFAYAGMYRVEDDKFIVKVDVSWYPDWVGTDQIRFFRFDGNRLHVVAAWMQYPRPGKGMARGILMFERDK
jgi:hypothetical protein